MRSAGLRADFAGGGEEKTGSAFRVYVDLYKVLNGRYITPGLKADYHCLFSLSEHILRDGTVLDLRTGPGVAAGLVRDRDKDRGYLIGLSGMASARMRFGDLSIEVGVSAILGCHIHPDRSDDVTLTLYANGLSGALLPEVTITYGF